MIKVRDIMTVAIKDYIREMVCDEVTSVDDWYEIHHHAPNHMYSCDCWHEIHVAFSRPGGSDTYIYRGNLDNFMEEVDHEDET